MSYEESSWADDLDGFPEPAMDEGDLTEDEKIEKHLQETDQMIEWLSRHEEELVARGINVREHLAGLEAARMELLRCHKECLAADERLLHALADEADTQRALFGPCKEIVNRLFEQSPSDPQVLELVEFMKEWERQLPRQ